MSGLFLLPALALPVRFDYGDGQPLSNIGTDRYLGYFNRAAVAAPFGTWGRNVLYGFPLRRTNLVLAKTFRLPAINERVRLTFRGEFDNLSHQTNFAETDVNLANATIGRVGCLNAFGGGRFLTNTLSSETIL